MNATNTVPNQQQNSAFNLGSSLVYHNRMEHKGWNYKNTSFSRGSRSLSEEIVIRLQPYTTQQSQLRFYIHQYPKARQLFISHPNLLWLLLSHAQQEQWAETKIVSCFIKKRRDILGECGLPDKESAVKLLKKLAFDHYGDREFAALTQLLRQKHYEKLNHIDNLDVRLAILLNDYPQLLGSRLISHYAPDFWGGGLYIYLEEIQLTAAQLDISDIFKQIGQCTGMPDIYKLYTRLVEDMNSRSWETVPEIHYNAPPLAGTDTIIPITMFRELALEGYDQNHCVQCYHKPVLDDEYYVYRVTYPQRATLGLKLQPGFKPQLDQLVLHHNQEVSKQTWEHVEAWLEKGQTSCSHGD